MHRLIGLLAMTFLFTPLSFAQEEAGTTCRLRFAVTDSLSEETKSGETPDDINSGTTEGARRRFGAPSAPDYQRLERWEPWPEGAKEWWDKTGKKNFPELCEADRKEADFVIAWQRDRTTQKSIQTVNAGSEVRWMDHIEYREGADCYPDPNGIAVFECKPVSSFTYYEVQVVRVSLTIHRVQADKLVPLKAVVKSGDKPGKASFQNAIKVLRKEAKRAAAANTR